ncbi:hypothetical protein D3C85_594780 [compost metagenome]
MRQGKRHGRLPLARMFQVEPQRRLQGRVEQPRMNQHFFSRRARGGRGLQPGQDAKGSHPQLIHALVAGTIRQPHCRQDRIALGSRDLAGRLLLQSGDIQAPCAVGRFTEVRLAVHHQATIATTRTHLQHTRLQADFKVDCRTFAPQRLQPDQVVQLQRHRRVPRRPQRSTDQFEVHHARQNRPAIELMVQQEKLITAQDQRIHLRRRLDRHRRLGCSIGPVPFPLKGITRQADALHRTPRHQRLPWQRDAAGPGPGQILYCGTASPLQVPGARLCTLHQAGDEMRARHLGCLGIRLQLLQQVFPGVGQHCQPVRHSLAPDLKGVGDIRQGQPRFGLQMLQQLPGDEGQGLRMQGREQDQLDITVIHLCVPLRILRRAGARWCRQYRTNSGRPCAVFRCVPPTGR